MNVLIAGAGIGGLCTALCLQKSGHQVQVFEQSKQLVEVGAGIQLGANALNVLDYLGVLSQLEEISVSPDRVDFCSYDSAKILHSADLGDCYRNKYGMPYLHVHRADLQRVLLQNLDQRIEIEYDSELVRFDEYSDSVSVEFKDGRTFSGDCLIAADGIKSVIRSTLVNCQAPVFTGNVAWRGIVSADRLPNDFMDKIVTNFVGPNKHMVIYYLRNQELVNFVGVVEDKSWQQDSWTEKASWQQLKHDFRSWHPTVQTLIDAMQGEDCYRWALYDHKPLRNWSSKRVTLLGDAAHATLPFLASGAAMAIEDSRVLQRALDQEAAIEQAFQLYQRNRYERTTKIQKLSRSMAKIYHMTNPLLLKLAFKVVKLKSAETEAFLADYDANKIRLQ